jgi:hypothetical protein
MADPSELHANELLARYNHDLDVTKGELAGALWEVLDLAAKRLDDVVALRARQESETLADEPQASGRLATQPQPIFEAVVKTTMPSSLHMDGTHPVTLAAWADTETLRQVKGQRVLVYPAAAGSATPTGDDRG